MNAYLLRALGFARVGEIQRAKDMLYDFEPRSQIEEQELDSCWRRLDQFASQQVLA
jgi:hypothetical protein